MNLDEYAELESKHYEWEELRFSKKDLQGAFNAGVKRGHSGYPDTDNWTQPKFEEWFNKFKNKQL